MSIGAENALADPPELEAVTSSRTVLGAPPLGRSVMATA
jgi:hypothetical protein